MDDRRKRLAFRCWHRGTKEMDLLMGSFADRHLPAMTEAQLDRFEDLLELPDPTLYAWLTGQSRPEALFDHDVTKLLLSFKYTPPTI